MSRLLKGEGCRSRGGDDAGGLVWFAPGPGAQQTPLDTFSSLPASPIAVLFGVLGVFGVQCYYIVLHLNCNVTKVHCY